MSVRTRLSSRLSTNLGIAVGAVVLSALMTPLSSHTPVNGGLGPDGLAFADMVRNFTLKGGDETTRLSPLFPALAWVPFVLTGTVLTAFALVNRFALGVLVFAACLLLDARGVGPRWKSLVALQLALAITFTRFAGFLPARPELCALASLMLAVSLCPSVRAVVTAASHVAAVTAMPVGLAAPVYGIARSLRIKEPSRVMAMRFAPAVVIWLGVQWWARGGVAGVVDDFTPSSLRRGMEVWGDPVFITFAAYFVVTSAAALSVVALARFDSSYRSFMRRPEVLVLCVTLLLYVVAARGDGLLAAGFLAPVWVILAGDWIADEGGARPWWVAAVAGTAIVLLTQRPFASIDITSYFVDWHPYDVLRGATPISYPQLWERWVPRFLIAAGCMWVLTLAGRSRVRPDDLSDAAPPLSPDVRDEPRESLVAMAIARGRRAVPSTIFQRVGQPWGRVAYGYALVLGGVTAYFLFGLPIQLSDSFANLLGIQRTSVWEIFKAEMGGTGYLRPLLKVQLKIVYDLANGNYFIWYRTVEALQVLAALLLVVNILKIRNLRDLAVLPVCLAILLGIHTFAGAIREAFPINTFLTLLLCCLLAVRIAQSRPRASVDVAAVALLTFSVLTLETGVLVWVIFVASWIVGYKGISRRTVVAASAVLAGYFVLRFALLHIGTPGFNERPSGFGFHTLEPQQIQERFGRHPLLLYVYNVACATLTVLFAEPRDAVWQLLADVSNRTVQAWCLINVVVSSLTSAVIAWYVANRAARWRRWDIDDGDRLVLLFLVVLPANAAFCFVYVKDVIMSPAGAFYALAAFVAVRALIDAAPRLTPARVSAASLLLLSMLSAGWGWRLVGIHYNLREQAAVARSDWAFEDTWEINNNIVIDTPEAAALKRTLLDDAIWRREAPPRLSPHWLGRYFDTTQ